MNARPLAARSRLRGGRSSLRGSLRRGFTLLEVLVAIGIVALVLVSMNTFVFSMGELWGKNTDLRLFELHVRNVTRFLERELGSAALPPFASVTEQGISVQEIRAQTGMTDNYLTFELPEGSRILNWPERALPDVMCALAVRDREGLVLLWHSRLEKKFADDPPRETVITPLVTEMSYDYYDTDFKNWKNERALRKNPAGEVVVPQRLRLKFIYGGRTIESLIGLPAVGQGMPML
ncbi:PulJ/GspJ family protein [Nibricoccus aquaticus]|uniref:PulJ/GspJ family protein n=1 Tax=Nibricoccus aquaticus TaxID=2576891 RepID=UPI00158688C3|nr:prepilin-type N-terminal cleavage/methylation domain-containing protein [Nibricoccus aquaticus]